MKQKTVEISVAADKLRTFKDPFGKHDKMTALVRIGDLPDSLPTEINPRNQNTGSRVARQIAATLTEDYENFHLFNRGITLTAGEAKFNNGKGVNGKGGILTLTFPNQHYGVLDGGHTYRVITENKAASAKDDDKKEPDFFNGFVQLEILTGIKRTDLIAELARARNTSAQVKEESLANLQGRFDWIKEALKDEPYLSKIAWRENEDSDDMPIGVREIIGFATMFHPAFEDTDTPPIIAYSSKGRCMEMFTGINAPGGDEKEKQANAEKWQQGYERMANILPHTLKLYDYVHKLFEKHYKALGGFSGLTDDGGKGKVKLGKVAEVRRFPNRDFPLHFLGEGIEFKFPDGWLYPVVASLRALVSYKGEKAQLKWKGDPFEYFDKHGKKLVELTLEMSRVENRNPNAVGKNKQHWIALHNKVIQKYLQLAGADTEKEVAM